jgi:type 2 lantibiotic biosynthesis protein LanM
LQRIAEVGADDSAFCCADELKRRQMSPTGALWAASLTLSERAKLRSSMAGELPPNATQKLIYWRNTPAFRDNSVFLQFLKALGVTEEIFLEVVAKEPPLAALSCAPPEFSQGVQELLKSAVTQPETHELRFLAFFAPLIAQFDENLLRTPVVIQATRTGFIDSKSVVPSLKALVLDRLATLVTRPLVLEMNIASHCGSLSGATSKERFDDFVRKLADSEFRLQILSRYPGIARCAIDMCGQWLESHTEMLERLLRDRDACAKFFGFHAMGPLTSVSSLSGDYHAGGRSVLLLEFGCGTRLVYKPRPQAPAVFFGSFMRWLNNQGLQLELRAPKVLDRGSYGWTEFAESQPCVSDSELEKYYERTGAYLAALYTLSGTDCHFENILAVRDHPMLVDVETLFQPRLTIHKASDDHRSRTDGLFADSVMSVGLLPTPTVVGDAIVDLSGIGAISFQQTHLESYGLTDIGTDQMRVVPQLFRTDEARNQPLPEGSRRCVAQYLKFIDRGFSSTYELIANHREELLGHDGLLCHAARITTRVLLRNTAAYSSLLEQSLHPQALRDGIARDRALYQLWNGVSTRPCLADVAMIEYRQMLTGDIPMFWSTAGETDVSPLDNAERIAGQIATSGYEVSRSRIASMSSADLAFQRWLISASICSLGGLPPCDDSARGPLKLAPTATSLEIAIAIGSRLLDVARNSGPSVSWLSLNDLHVTSQHRVFSIQEASLNLYDGLPGIALFLAYLGSLTSIEEMTTCARGAARTIDIRLAHEYPTMGCGAFDGLCGIAYTYSHLGALWKDEQLLNRAKTIVSDVKSRISEDTCFDVISGSAGAILALLVCHRIFPASGALNVALEFGRHLIQSNLQGSQRASAKLISRYRRGMSHGLAGMAYALVELGVASGQTEFLNHGLLVTEAERLLFRDGRFTDECDPRLDDQATWCHGSAGIALARLGILRRYNSPEIASDVRQALEDLASKPTPKTHGLCHGTLGIVETLVLAKDVLREERWEARSKSLAEESRRDVAANGCRTDRPGAVEVPGLMTGLAGIGLGMLRLCSVDATPNVLLLS